MWPAHCGIKFGDYGYWVDGLATGRVISGAGFDAVTGRHLWDVGFVYWGIKIVKHGYWDDGLSTAFNLTGAG